MKILFSVNEYDSDGDIREAKERYYAIGFKDGKRDMRERFVLLFDLDSRYTKQPKE